jgi:hypothetical protein
MGGDTLSSEEAAIYSRNLEKVDWKLPGMEKFHEHQIKTLKRSIEIGTIVNSIHSLGWSLWPTKNEGYYDEHWLRTIADFIEIQNKPFWDEYEKYCEEQHQRDEENNVEDDDFFT